MNQASDLMGIVSLVTGAASGLGRSSSVEVDDVGDLVAFLASDVAFGYHGACITIDKGISAG